MFQDQTPTRSLIIAVSLLTFTASLIISARLVAQTPPPFVIWVYDKNVRDSQFGYYDGVHSQTIGVLYPNLDAEGLACMGAQPYASSGGDGRVPSQLFTLGLDLAQNQTTLNAIGVIQQSDGRPFYEVSSLTYWQGQTLLGFAADSGTNSAGRGLIQIDATSGVAQLIVASTLDVADIIWHNGQLWLAAGNQIYTWQPGGTIQPAFAIAELQQIEALEWINGVLYVGGDDVITIYAFDPQSGGRLPQADFAVPDDIEGMTFCPPPTQATPTATATATETATATPTATATATQTPTTTPTATATATATATPTDTGTPPGGQSTETPTATSTVTPPPTLTPTATATPVTPAPRATQGPTTTDLEATAEPKQIVPTIFLALIDT